MNRRVITYFLLVASLVINPTGLVRAAHSEQGGKTKKTEAISQKIYAKIKAIHDQVEQKQYTPALTQLEALRSEKLTSYELSQIWNLQGYIHYLRGHYPQAIRAYQHVLDYDRLPEGIVQSTLKTISQLYFTEGDYSKALETVQRLMHSVTDPSADTHILLGQIYYQMKNYTKALAPIKRGIQKHEAQGNTAKENWLLHLRAIYHELDQYKQMVAVLKKLIRHYPNNSYVLTLAGVYSQLGDTKRQLALLEPLHEKDEITKEATLINLANLYLLHDRPIKAAQLLQREINAGRVASNERGLRLLAQAWQMAREDEQALQPLEQAANLSNDGKLYVQLAQSFLNLERWEKVEQVLNKALAKGELKTPGQAQLMLGMAQFKQRKLQLAHNTFSQAEAYKMSRKSAQQWLSYVDSEIQQQVLKDKGLPVYYRRQGTQKMLQELEERN